MTAAKQLSSHKRFIREHCFDADFSIEKFYRNFDFSKRSTAELAFEKAINELAKMQRPTRVVEWARETQKTMATVSFPDLHLYSHCFKRLKYPLIL